MMITPPPPSLEANAQHRSGTGNASSSSGIVNYCLPLSTAATIIPPPPPLLPMRHPHSLVTTIANSSSSWLGTSPPRRSVHHSLQDLITNEFFQHSTLPPAQPRPQQQQQYHNDSSSSSSAAHLRPCALPPRKRPRPDNNNAAAVVVSTAPLLTTKRRLRSPSPPPLPVSAASMQPHGSNNLSPPTLSPIQSNTPPMFADGVRELQQQESRSSVELAAASTDGTGCMSSPMASGTNLTPSLPPPPLFQSVDHRPPASFQLNGEIPVSSTNSSLPIRSMLVAHALEGR